MAPLFFFFQGGWIFNMGFPRAEHSSVDNSLRKDTQEKRVSEGMEARSREQGCLRRIGKEEWLVGGAVGTHTFTD